MLNAFPFKGRRGFVPRYFRIASDQFLRSNFSRSTSCRRSCGTCTSRADQPGKGERGITPCARVRFRCTCARYIRRPCGRPPARSSPIPGIDRYHHPRTRSYDINEKMSRDARVPSRLTSRRVALHRVATAWHDGDLCVGRYI